MKLIRSSTLLLVPAALAVAACQPTTPTVPSDCRGVLGAVTVEFVSVPLGATCTLEGTDVTGNVQVQEGGRLIARNASIGGSVQADRPQEVRLGQATTVVGSVQVKGGAAVSVNDASITGDLQFDDNPGSVEARRNRVGGSTQVMANRGVTVLDANQISGDLQCKDNLPAPTGGGNVVGGNKQDQCRNL